MKFKITSPYGATESIRNGQSHTGIDINTPMDTPIRTITDGLVEKTVKFGHGKIGNEVVIKDDDGVYHIYGHLDKVNVLEGQHVNEGDLIGLSGASGHVTGPHLHYGEEAMGSDGKLHFIDPTNHADSVISLAGGSELVANNGEGFFENMIWNFLHAVQHVALDLLDSSYLIISGVLIILTAVGFKKGKQYLWVLFAARIILKLCLGGYLT